MMAVEIPVIEQFLPVVCRQDNQGFVGLRSVGEPEYGLDVPAETFERALAVVRR